MERPVLRTERGKCRKVSEQRHLYNIWGNFKRTLSTFRNHKGASIPDLSDVPEYPPKELFQDAKALPYHLMYSFLMSLLAKN
jgi:hypothetical protein